MTINVPRELLERLAEYAPTGICAPTALQGFAIEARRLLSAPSPAGVDGLEVVGYLLIKGNQLSRMPAGAADEPLCRLSDAQAIIDGLRGENQRTQQELRLHQSQIESSGRIAERAQRFAVRLRTERDQQAQRIGELEAALEFACKSLVQVTSSDGSGHADIAVSVLRMAGRKEADASQIVEAYKAGAKWRIDAALSAGKEKQDEHN